MPKMRLLLSLCCFLLCWSFLVRSQENPDKVHQPWFHDAYSYWDFDEAVNDSVLDIKRQQWSTIVGEYNLIPGPRDNALELIESSSSGSSHVILGDFSNTCLPNPQNCRDGFTITFWVNLRKVLHDGVLLQLALTRKSRGITVNTVYKDGAISLAFYANTPARIYRVKTGLSSNIWHHVAIIWNATAETKMSLFLNCSMINRELSTEIRESRKDADKVLILGANHAGKKPTPIAVDDFAIWFKSVEQRKVCQAVDQRRVHGNYSFWSEFSACSSSCGPGRRTRTRLCNNPSPDYGGRDCSSIGPASEIQKCNEKPCPIAGGYTAWSEFSHCSLSCGGGKRYRTRNCSNPAPQYGGGNCSQLGEAFDVQECNTSPCPVHGNYSSWSDFNQCSTSCGIGVQVRNRSCTNPAPTFGGRNCSGLGLAYEVKECNLEPCPVDGGYSEWSAYTPCSKSCGNNASRKRTRTCTNPKSQFGGRNCSVLGLAYEVRECNLGPCPVDGGFTEWSTFFPCSKSCGNGTKIRIRTCANPKPSNGGRNCSFLGSNVDIVYCSVQPCPVNGNYSTWSEFSTCDRTCDSGTMFRKRFCTNPEPRYGGRNCSSLGSDTEIRPCNEFPCPVHGNFSEWSSFSECSSICGNSTKSRTRNCSNPAPMHGGKDCSVLGPYAQVVKCHVGPCPVHGNFSEWSGFSECTRTCGNSTRVRTRTCTNPVPLYRGNNCSSLGPRVQVSNCDVPECPVNGNFSEWSLFGPCSRSCGKGTQKRKRTCANPMPRFGGKDCETIGPSSETRSCFLRACPVHGNYSEWSEFSKCSTSCGLGIKKRYRLCSNPKPRFGGKNCSTLGASVEVIFCNLRPCPVHGNYSEWSSFGLCSKTCENGTQVRWRSCDNPSPRHGGRNCSILGPTHEIRQCETQACPDIDLVVEFKLNNDKWNGNLFNESSETYQLLSSELITAIFGLHNKGVVRDVKILQFRKGSVIAFVEVIYFSRNFPGAAVLYDAFSKDRKIGVHEVTLLKFTSSDVPFGFPQNLTAYNLSSTILGLRWSPLSHTVANGDILGYSVMYKGQNWTDKKTVHEAFFLNTTTGSLKQLKKYSWYSIRIAARNRRGIGVPSPAIVVLTDEDVPNSSPNLKPSVYNTSSVSLYVTWKAIPKDDVNGILRGYRVFYKPLSHNVSQCQIVLPDILSVSLTGLYKYMAYEIQVAGVTSKGIGRRSNRTVEYTDEDIPDAAPQFHSCHNVSSTAIQLQWHEIPQYKRNGIILGYNMYYRPTGFLDHPEKEINSISAEKMAHVVRDLKMFTNYSFRISAFTRKGEGTVSKNITVSTDEDVPCAAPSEVTAVSYNSTVFLDWRPLSAYCARGILRGYTVFYKRKSESQQAYQNISVPPMDTELNVTHLRKYTTYDFSVAGYTSKGLGPRSPSIRERTAEDVPSKPPMDFRAFNTSSTSIQLLWKPIPRQFIHGVLQGYHIHLRKANETHLEKKVTLSASDNSYSIGSLLKYTKYFVRIVGFTNPGSGVATPEVTVSTDEDIPSRIPEELKAVNKSFPASIPLSWKAIKDSFYVHGVLLGYKIEYELVRLAGEPSKDSVDKAIKVVGPKVLTHVLTGLKIYATYRVKIRAFTRIGDGLAAEILAETCRCRSSYQTNWWINPPYAYMNSSEASGILPAILPRMVSTCCGYCHEHNSTITRFEYHFNQLDEHSKFLKSGISAVRDSLDNSIELHFPMPGQRFQRKYYKRYEFVPLVESPGVAFLVMEDEADAASKMLLRTLWSTVPVILLTMALVCLFAIIIWFADNLSNPDHFPHSFLSGFSQGLWWSFVTMTAIGYGDRFPRSVAARALGMLWILIGAIIIALYTSFVTSNITTKIVASDVKLYGTKVAVIQNSSEYRLAIRKNAKADLGIVALYISKASCDSPYNNLYDIYNALISRRVQGALVDAYVLGSRRDLFDNTGIRISKMYDYSSAYGVVLAGEAMKLQKCFREYVNENRKEIFQIIEVNVDVIEEDSISQSVKKAKSLIDPTSFVYMKCLFISLILLFIAIIFGVLYEFLRERLKKKLYRSHKTYAMAKLMENRKRVLKVLLLELQDSIFEFMTRVDKLKRKHQKEWKQWIKMKKTLSRKWRLSEESLILSSSVVRYDSSHRSPVLEMRKFMVVSKNDSNNSRVHHFNRVRKPSEETTV